MEYIIIGLLVVVIILLIILIAKKQNNSEMIKELSEFKIELTKELATFKYDLNKVMLDEFIKMNHVPLLAELPFNNGVSHLNNEDAISEADTQSIKDWILPVVDYLFNDII